MGDEPENNDRDKEHFLPPIAWSHKYACFFIYISCFLIYIIKTALALGIIKIKYRAHLLDRFQRL